MPGGRWTFGFADPNQAGLLAALLAVAGILILLRGRGRGRIAGWGAGIAAAALVAIVLAGSRSALLATAAAAALAAPWAWAGRAGVIAAALLLAAAAGLCAVRPATMHPSGDGSVINRAHIWRTAPALLRDHPDGCRDPGDAYSNWYQPPAVGEYYTCLVSAHLQALARAGHGGRVLYVLVWLAALLLAATAPRGRAWAVACWTVLAVSGCAAMAIAHPLFLVLAALHLAWLLHGHLADPGARRRLPRLGGLFAVLAALLAGLGWLALRLAPRPGPVPVAIAADGTVVVGRSGDPLVAAIIAPSRRRCAATHGLELRRLAAEEGWRLLVVPDPAAPPPPRPPPPLFISSAGPGGAWFARWRPDPAMPWGIVEPRDLPPAGPDLATVLCLAPLADAGARTVVERHWRRAGYAVAEYAGFREAVRAFARGTPAGR